jgi:iron complex outermembrane receptor protein
MNRQNRRIALLLTAAIGMGWDHAALAQQAKPEDKPDGEIIVTAQRAEQRLSDVPISITVMDQKALASRNIVALTDLANYVPGLSTNQRFGPERATFTIRGFGQDPGTSPSVGVYFAEVPGIRVQGGSLSGNTVGPDAFMDLQNVQVLKGPQGTLFGRNTTGGAVLLVPNKPTDRFEGWIEGQLGNYNARRLQAVLNIPLADTFKVRFAIDRNMRDGYLRNHSGVGPDTFNDTDYTALRGTIEADLTPNLKNVTIAHYSHSHTAGYAARLAACDRTLSAATVTAASPANFNGIQAAAACDQIDRQAARGDGLLDVDVNTPGAFLDIRQWQIINTTTWDANDHIKVRNIASYGQYQENSRISSFSDNLVVSTRTPFFRSAPGAATIAVAPGTPFNLNVSSLVPGFDGVFKTAWTEELQVQGKSDRFNWVVGGYIENNREPKIDPRRNFVTLSCSNYDTQTCSDPFGIGSISESRNKYDYDSKGLYGQGTYDFTEKLALTLGARYTWDSSRAQAANSRIVRIGTPTQARVCTDTFRFNSGFNAAGRPIALTVTDPFQCLTSFTEKSAALTGNANLTYKPASGLMFYGRYARGYRQGGINTTPVAAETWKPEFVDSFEIGAKTTFHGAVRGFLNASAFYNKLHDTQVPGQTVPLPSSGLTSTIAIFNGGEGTIKGIELDGSVQFFDSLRIEAGYTYLTTEINGIPASIPVAGGAITSITPNVINGSGLLLTPKNRVTATATYTLPLPPEAGDLSVSTTFTHTDSQIANATAGPIGVLPATDLLNLSLNWNKVLGSQFDFSIFGTNVTNKIYEIATTFSAPYSTILIGQPRIWGARMRVNFGK